MTTTTTTTASTTSLHHHQRRRRHAPEMELWATDDLSVATNCTSNGMMDSLTTQSNHTSNSSFTFSIDLSEVVLDDDNEQEEEKKEDSSSSSELEEAFPRMALAPADADVDVAAAAVDAAAAEATTAAATPTTATATTTSPRHRRKRISLMVDEFARAPTLSDDENTAVRWMASLETREPSASCGAISTNHHDPLVSSSRSNISSHSMPPSAASSASASIPPSNVVLNHIILPKDYELRRSLSLSARFEKLVSSVVDATNNVKEETQKPAAAAATTKTFGAKKHVGLQEQHLLQTIRGKQKQEDDQRKGWFSRFRTGGADQQQHLS